MKTKINSKIIMALGIILLAVLVLNSSIVNAAEIDETYVKNLKLTSPKYYEVDLDYISYSTNSEEEFMAECEKVFKIIGNYYEKQINNKAITVKASSMAGGTDDGLNMWTHPTTLSIYLNGKLVDTRDMLSEFAVPVINVPSTISDSELNNYIKNIITKSYKEYGEQITKIEKGTKDVAHIDIPDGYTVYSNRGYESVVIVRKEKVTEPVKKEETTTKIKLEADTTVIPSNTVLETKEVKEEKTLKVVKESLKEVSNKYVTYDITLTSNNVKIQPNGKVKISIPVPNDFDKTKLAVYRIAEDGTKTKYDTKIDGEYATIETDHFSTYVLAENNVTINETPNTENTQKTETTTKGEKDNTPKTGSLDIIGYVLVITVVAGIGIVTLKKRF